MLYSLSVFSVFYFSKFSIYPKYQTAKNCCHFARQQRSSRIVKLCACVDSNNYYLWLVFIERNYTIFFLRGLKTHKATTDTKKLQKQLKLDNNGWRFKRLNVFPQNNWQIVVCEQENPLNCSESQSCRCDTYLMSYRVVCDYLTAQLLH